MMVGKIYSETQIKVVALLGNPLIAAYMVTENFKSFNKPQRIAETWLFAGLLTVVFIVLSKVDPKLGKALALSLPFLNAALIGKFTRTYQADRIKAFKSNGGQFYGYGRILIIFLIGLLLSICMVLAINFLFNKFIPPPPPYLPHR